MGWNNAAISEDEDGCYRKTGCNDSGGEPVSPLVSRLIEEPFKAEPLGKRKVATHGVHLPMDFRFMKCSFFSRPPPSERGRQLSPCPWLPFQDQLPPRWRTDRHQAEQKRDSTEGMRLCRAPARCYRPIDRWNQGVLWRLAPRTIMKKRQSCLWRCRDLLQNLVSMLLGAGPCCPGEQAGPRASPQRFGLRHYVVYGEAELLHAERSGGGGAEAVDRHGVTIEAGVLVPAEGAGGFNHQALAH